MSNKDNERDDFWDLDKLVPKRKVTVSPFRTSPATVTYTAPGDVEKGSEERKISFEAFRGVSTSEDTVYDKEGGLIRRVTIRRFADRFDFYGSFRKAALIYYDYRTEKCDFAPFYSYMPQYSQLTSEQKNYYFYWRDSLRHGKYLKSDYSYLYLYVYEILNLPDKIPPKEGLLLLTDLWREYRVSLPRIDAYLSLWVEDYCLVYDLSCPTEKIRPFISEAIAASGFKEFYLSGVAETGEAGVDSVLAYLSDYDWRRGKFSGGENSELYKTHMLSAMRRILSFMDLGDSYGGGESAILKRDAFAHSLCTHAVKCKLEIEYSPLGRSTEIRAIITGAVRYTENKLRALFGIKSRLAVKGLPQIYSGIIDRYFRELLIEAERKRAVRELPEYERLYDAPSGELSFTGADEIELASWSITKRLVAEEEDAPFVEEGIALSEDITLPTETEETVADAPDYGLSKEDILAILDIMSGRKIDDSTAERINEAFADGFGDVILQHDGEGYRIIEDYEEEIGEWLLKTEK